MEIGPSGMFLIYAVQWICVLIKERITCVTLKETKSINITFLITNSNKNFILLKSTQTLWSRAEKVGQKDLLWYGYSN